MKRRRFSLLEMMLVVVIAGLSMRYGKDLYKARIIL